MQNRKEGRRIKREGRVRKRDAGSTFPGPEMRDVRDGPPRAMTERTRPADAGEHSCGASGGDVGDVTMDAFE